MPDWDEEALRELNSLDSARLAIRGALATIRDLQDQTAKLKQELQDETARRRGSESQIGDLKAVVERWQAQAKEWEAAEKNRALEEERYRASVRLQVRSEERLQIQEGQRRLEEELSKLQAELQRMAADHLKKEEQWSAVRKRLEQREAELVQAEREKAEMSNRYRADMEVVENLRVARDRELAAGIKSRELELDDRNREIAALRSESAELKAAVAALGKDWQLKLQESEEKLARDYQLKERALQERYAKRELDLQASWSELENGLWKRAKDAREKLDKAAGSQFEERARALADRSAEIEQHLEHRRRELDEDFKRRCAQAEARYAEMERTQQAGWLEKEDRFLKKFEAEIAAEKARLQADWSGKLKALEVERGELELGLQRRREELEHEVQHQKELLLEDAARKDAERVRRQDDFVSKQSSELERLYQEKLAELSNRETLMKAQALEAESARQAAALEHRRKGDEELNQRRLELVNRDAELKKQYQEKLDELSQRGAAAALEAQKAEAARKEAALELKRAAEAELNRKRIELIDANAQSLELARQSLDKQFAERVAALDASYAVKIDELDRARKAAEDNLLQFKARLATEHSLKEKNLDGRWAAREQELVSRYEGQLQAQRDDFEGRLRGLREEQQAHALKEQSGLLNRKNELEAHYEGLERGLRAEIARREEDMRRRFEAQLGDLRDKHLKEAQQQAELGAAELARVKNETSGLLVQLRASLNEAGTRQAQLEADLADATRRLQGQFDDFQARQRSWEAERLALEQQYREREAQREAKYHEMERSLQDLWSKKEEAAALSRLKAMEAQKQSSAEQSAKAEEALRRQFEQARQAEQADLEQQRATWMSAREQDLAERRRILEAHYEARMAELNGQMRKREVELQRQKDDEMDKLRAEMNAYLKEREAAFNARLLALQHEQAMGLEQQRSKPQSPSEDAPKSSD